MQEWFTGENPNNISYLYFTGELIPYIESITPSVIPKTGTTNISIKGGNFIPTNDVSVPPSVLSIGGASSVVYSVISPTEISAIVTTNNASGSLPVVVANGDRLSNIWGDKSIAILSDPYFQNVVLLLRGEGENNSTSILDSSSAPKIIVRGGTAKISTDQKRYGNSSIFFNGSSDYLSLSNDSAFFLDANFTIECWFFTASTGEKSLFSYDSASGLYFNNSSFTWWKDGIGSILPSHSISITTNQWHHVAICKSGNSLSLYFNGNFIVTGSLASSVDLRSKAIALRPYSPNFHGYIDSFRITKGVARYASSFNPGTATYLE